MLFYKCVHLDDSDQPLNDVAAVHPSSDNDTVVLESERQVPVPKVRVVLLFLTDLEGIETWIYKWPKDFKP